MSTTGGRGVLEKVAVALDTNDRATFERWCAFFGPRVGVLKVGLEAFVRWGPPAIEVARRHSRGLFLDLKLHDIPNTVAGAVRSAREFAVDYLTIHSAGGPAMIAAAAVAVRRWSSLPAAPWPAGRIPGATSLNGDGSAARKAASSSGEQTTPAAPASRARCAQRSARRELPPGRSSRSSVGSSRWVSTVTASSATLPSAATAAAAIAAGADLIVIGRPLTQAADPEAALAALALELA